MLDACYNSASSILTFIFIVQSNSSPLHLQQFLVHLSLSWKFLINLIAPYRRVSSACGSYPPLQTAAPSPPLNQRLDPSLCGSNKHVSVESGAITRSRAYSGGPLVPTLVF